MKWDLLYLFQVKLLIGIKWGIIKRISMERRVYILYSYIYLLNDESLCDNEGF